MSTSSSKVCSLESSKSDVNPSILQKRVHLPKCALEQVKEVILEGRHHSVIEQSGLDRDCQEDSVPVNSSDRYEGTGRLQNINSVEISAPRLEFAQLSAEYGEIVVQQSSHTNNLDCTKYETTEQNLMQSMDGKGIWFDGPTSCEQSSKGEAHSMDEISTSVAPAHVNKTIQEGPTDVSLVSSKRKSSDCTERRQVGCLDGNEQCPNVKKRMDGTLKYMGQIKDPLVMKELLEEPVDDSCLNNFDEEIESNLCIKCNRGGHLLSCFISSCPIVVHESCLGSAANVDGMGNFCCPFCSLSQATDAYKETLQEFYLAKKKAASARNHYLQFVHSLNVNKHKQTSETLSTENQSRTAANGDCLHETEHQRESEVAGECCNALNTGVPMSSVSEERQERDFMQCETFTSNALNREVLNNREDPVVGNGLSKTQTVGLPLILWSPLKVNAAETPVNSPSIDTEAPLNRREHADNGTGIAVLPEKNVCLSQGPAVSLNKNAVESYGKSPSVDREAVRNCRELADVGTEVAVLQKQTIDSPRVSLPSSNVKVVEIPVNLPIVDTLAPLHCLGYTDVETDDACLTKHNVSLPQGPSIPLNCNVTKISGKLPCVVAEAVSYRSAEERIADAVLEEQTVKSPQESSRPWDVNVGEISASPAHLESESFSSSQENADEYEDVLQQPVNLPQDVLNEDEAEISEDEDGGWISFELKRRRLPAMQLQEVPSSRHPQPVMCNQEFLSRRRMKTPWTSEEEEKLKEGVEKFATMGKKNIPWKRILEFGHDVFSESRNAVDLKDKWKRL